MKIEKIKQLIQIRLVGRIELIGLISFIGLIVLIGQIKIAHAGLITKAPNNLGLVGAWSFDEGVGNRVGDSSGNGFNGTATSTFTWSAGKHGKSFSGASSGYIDLGLRTLGPKLNGATSITMSAWINPTSYPAGTNRTRVVGFYHNGNTAGLLGLHSSSGNIEVGGRSNNSDSFLSATTTVAQMNTWTHVVGILNFTADTIQIYVNGSLVITSSVNFSSNTYVDGLPILNDAIGGYSSGETFGGKIDDVRVYARQLTASQASDLYKSGQVTRKTVSNQGLLGYWSLNEGRGNIASDSSTQRNTGVLTGFALNGATSNWTVGKKGTALNFDGNNDYVDAGNPTSLDLLTQLSVCAWVKHTSVTSDDPIVSKRVSHGFLLFRDDVGAGGNDIYSFFVQSIGGGSGRVESSSSTTPVGVWTHVCGTFLANSATGYNLYVNGTQAATPVSSVGVLDSGGTGVNVLIGSAVGSPFDGSIDEARVYNRVLSAAEVQALYRQNETKINSSQNSKLTNGLVGLWSFDGADYNRASTTAEVLDRSGQGNNGNAANGATPAIGKIGQGIKFDGVNSVVDLNSRITLSNEFTLSFWYNSLNNYNEKCMIGDDTNQQKFCVLSGNYFFRLLNGGSNDSTISTVGTSTWISIVITRNSSDKVDMYINGGSSQRLFSDAAQTGDFNIGYLGQRPGGATFDGSLDEVRLYNHTLSTDEIKQLYNMGK